MSLNKLFLSLVKLQVIRAAAFIAFLIPMLLTRNLWFSNRGFPLVPLFGNAFELPIYIDISLILIFITLFFFFIFNSSWKIGLGVVLIYVAWAFLDQNRLQPYFFEIILVVLALSSFSKDENLSIQCLLLIFVGTYFWSGLHKYNDLFIDKWMNGLNKRIPFVPYWMRLSFTYAIPFLEAAFGLGLLFVKTRKMAIWLIAIMHCIILITFIKDGNGYTVFPLTIFNVFTLFYVFYNDTSNALTSVTKPSGVKKLFFIFWMLLLPMANLIGVYDHILSFSYFSGKPKYARIVFESKDETANLPDAMKMNLREYNGYYYIDLNEWASRTIRVLVYPEIRVYKKIQKEVDLYTTKPSVLQYY